MQQGLCKHMGSVLSKCVQAKKGHCRGLGYFWGITGKIVASRKVLQQVEILSTKVYKKIQPKNEPNDPNFFLPQNTLWPMYFNRATRKKISKIHFSTFQLPRNFLRRLQKNLKLKFDKNGKINFKKIFVRFFSFELLFIAVKIKKYKKVILV